MGCSSSSSSSESSLFINSRIITESGKTFAMQLTPSMLVWQVKSRMEMCIAAPLATLKLFIKPADLEPVEMVDETSILNYIQFLKENPVIFLEQQQTGKDQRLLVSTAATPTKQSESQSIATTACSNANNNNNNNNNAETQIEQPVTSSDQTNQQQLQQPQQLDNSQDHQRHQVYDDERYFKIKSESISLANFYPQFGTQQHSRIIGPEDYSSSPYIHAS